LLLPLAAGFLAGAFFVTAFFIAIFNLSFPEVSDQRITCQTNKDPAIGPSRMIPLMRYGRKVGQADALPLFVSGEFN